VRRLALRLRDCCNANLVLRTDNLAQRPELEQEVT
jgi:hypothetical protein